MTDTAQAIDLIRQTVSEWLHYHPGFQEALHSRRQELWVGMTDALRGLLPKALEVLKPELEGETPLPTAVHVLKACGLYGMPASQGPTEVEDAVIAQRRRAYERMLTSLVAGPVEAFGQVHHGALGRQQETKVRIGCRRHQPEPRCACRPACPH